MSGKLPMFSLEMKVAVITGGASGIGAATARRLRDAGAHVVVGDLPGRCDEARAAGFEAVAVDVSVEDQVLALLARARELYDRLDIVVNNAGVGTTESISELDEAALHRNFDVNLNGVVWATKHAHLLADGGAIVNVSSLAAQLSFWGYAAYSASKAAVVSLTKTAAIELSERRIRVNCVCPSAVDTPMLYEPGADVERAIITHLTPLGRFATAEEIAAAIHFLASDESAFVTGQALVVDGGFTAGIAPSLAEVLANRAPSSEP